METIHKKNSSIFDLSILSTFKANLKITLCSGLLVCSKISIVAFGIFVVVVLLDV